MKKTVKLVTFALVGLVGAPASCTEVWILNNDLDPTRTWKPFVEQFSIEAAADARKHLDLLKIEKLGTITPIVLSVTCDIGDPIHEKPSLHENVLALVRGADKGGDPIQCLAVFGRNPYQGFRQWEFGWNPTLALDGTFRFDTWRHEMLPVSPDRIRQILEFHQVFPGKVGSRTSFPMIGVFFEGWKEAVGRIPKEGVVELELLHKHGK